MELVMSGMVHIYIIVDLMDFFNELAIVSK